MRRTPHRQAALKTLLALCFAVGATACDKGEESDAKDKKDEKKEDGGDDGAVAKADGGDKKEADAKDGDEKVDPKDAEIAKLKAELEAAKEAEEAAKELDPEKAKELDEAPTPEDEVGDEKKLAEGEKGPVSLASVEFSDKTSFGSRGTMFEISAEVTVNEAKDGGVYAKATCAVGDHVLVNTTTVSSKYGELGKMKEGDKKRLNSFLFSNGLPDKPSKCQLSFDYGASDFSTRLADFCWDGSEVKDGACEEPIKADKEGDGKVVPFDFKVTPKPAMLASTSKAESTAIDLAYNTRFNEHLEKAPHLHTKTACKVGETTWVEVSPDFPHVKPFSIEPGESVRVHHNQFFLDALPGKPEACNIEVFLDGGYGNPDEKLTEVCAKDAGVTEGKCSFREDPKNAPAPAATDSISIDELMVKWGKDWRDDKKVVLNVHLAATVQKPISNRVQMTAAVNCSAKDDGEHHIGPDLEYIGEGETVGITMAAFRKTPLDKPDGRCEVTFGAKPFMSVGEAVELTKFCVKGAKITAGKCKGKGKGKAVDVDTEVVFEAKGK